MIWSMTRCLLWTTYLLYIYDACIYIATFSKESRHVHIFASLLHIYIYIHIEFIIVWYAWFVYDCIHAPCAKREVIWYGTINDFQGRNKSDGRANSTTNTMRLDYVMVLIFRLWHYLYIYIDYIDYGTPNGNTNARWCYVHTTIWYYLH